MGTKSHPGVFDCYAKAEPDEPIFTLLGRDRLAPSMIDIWAISKQRLSLHELDPKHPEHEKQLVALEANLFEALDCASAMRNHLYLLRKKEVRVLQWISTEILQAELQRRADEALRVPEFQPSGPIALEQRTWPSTKRANGSHVDLADPEVVPPAEVEK